MEIISINFIELQEIIKLALWCIILKIKISFNQ